MKFLAIVLFILSAVGYILNIVKLCGLAGVTGLLALRVIGIFFPPLGVIMGYIPN